MSEASADPDTDVSTDVSTDVTTAADTESDTDPRHEVLRLTDRVIGAEAAVEQYRIKLDRVTEQLATRERELAAERAELRGVREDFMRVTRRLARLTNDLNDARETLTIADRQYRDSSKRVEAMLASPSWRVGNALVGPLGRTARRVRR